MKLYITLDSKKEIRKYYKKLISRDMIVVDIRAIAKLLECEDYKENFYKRVILTEEIKKQFKNYYKSKRFNKILYIVDTINYHTIINLKNFFKENNIFFLDFTLIDCEEQVNDKLGLYFDYVL